VKMFPDYEHLNDFYGHPDRNSNGLPDREWEAANLIKVKPPYNMFWSWDLIMVRTITLHKKCAPAFLAALEGIRDEYSEFERKRLQLDRCGGGYNFRLMRGGNRLSVHSWGAALDLAPEKNWLGRRYDEKLGMMPMKVVSIFEKNGLKWGGRFQRPDAMHFEATS
jgi:hypothetical protein